MALVVPPAMEAVLQDADRGDARLDEGALWTAQMKGRPDPKTVSSEENLGAFAEIAAWRFMRAHNGDSEPWGLYWGPLGSGVLADGKTPFYSPDIAEIDEEVLSHWIGRALSCKHPVIKSRYADLAWEIGRYLKHLSKNQSRPTKPVSLDIPFSLVQIAVDGYLDAVERDLAEDEYHCWTFLDRALALSLSIKDQQRISRAKAELFSYHRKAVTQNSKMWWRFPDLAEAHCKALNFSEDEQCEVRNFLEAILKRTSNIADRETFNPHDSMRAADHLIRLIGNDLDERRRVIKQAGAAFESIAKESSGMLAISFLEGLIPRYRNIGLIEDAARVERAVRERADQARSEMKRISVPVEIPKDDLEKWTNEALGGSLEDALKRIAWFCMIREEGTKKTVLEMAEKSPLVSMMTASIMGPDGFTEAIVNSVEADLEGRAIQQAANSFSWNAPLLYFVLNRAKEKYGFTVDSIVAHLNKAPFFAPSRDALLREGITAWLQEDPVKAIHVLVPQLEAACRDLLAALGAPVMRRDPHTCGFEVIGLGTILNQEAFRKGVPSDIRFHLRALYSDQRGINLRNHLAHGMAQLGTLGMGTANWVVHSLLLLAILSIKQPPTVGSQEPSN